MQRNFYFGCVAAIFYSIFSPGVFAQEPNEFSPGSNELESVYLQKNQKNNIQLWGLTTTGGAGNQGTIFNFDTQTGTFYKQYDYQHADYYISLSGNLVKTPGGFAALSIADGTGAGEIITLAQDGSAKVIDTYAAHNGSLMLGSDNHLYVVDDWINYFRGGIYRIHYEGDDVNPLDRIIFRFQSEGQGVNPHAQLMELNKTLYGITPMEGAGGKGTLFKIGLDGSAFTVLHSFSGMDGDSPSGSLIHGGDGFVYGVTTYGGTSNQGVIFKIRPDGSDFATIFSFGGRNGSHPQGSLLWYNGKLYGTTSSGGNFGQGVIFSIKPDGKGFKVLHYCDGKSSGAPLGGLTAANKMLYGMTSAGGDSGLGVIFQVRENGSGFTTLFSFTTETGGAPNGNLLLTGQIERSGSQPVFSSGFPESKETFEGISVYPNPFKDTFTAFVSTPGEGTLQFTISDMKGNVLQKLTGPINIPLELGSDLEQGVYILTISNGSSVTTQKLIKR